MMMIYGVILETKRPILALQGLSMGPATFQ